MLITYANVLLASHQLALGRVGPFELTGPAGEPIVDEYNLFRADYATLFARGRRAKQFGFKVTAFFKTEAEVLAFIALHEDTLPTQGDLILFDDSESVALLAEDAIVTVRIERVAGVSVVVTYSFRLAQFTSEDVVPVPGGEASVKAAELELEVDDESKAVTFEAPFITKPRFVQGVISAPDGGVAIQAIPRESTRATTGVTFDFTAKIPAAGYVLLVTAIL